MFKNRVLRKTIRSKKQKTGENCRMESFAVCILRQILLGDQINKNELGGMGREGGGCMWHACGIK